MAIEQRQVRRNRSISIRYLVIAAGLSGCAAVGPDYQPPQITPPQQWHAGPANALNTAPIETAALATWWTMLNDPLLSRYIEAAAADNLDLALARSRLREARARRGLSAADRYPSIGLSGSASSSRSDPDSGPTTTSELYALGLDASWEIDIFGGKRRALEAATAQMQASEEHLRDVLVSLLAEVALNYIDIRAFQARLAIAQNNLQLQQDSYELVRWRADAGLTTELDVKQAEFSLEQTRAQLPALQSGLQQSSNRLALLLGQRPGALAQELSMSAPIPLAPVEVAIGIPAETLRRRPDVRRAERQLAAQTAQVGVAQAARYPDLSLLGSIGLESTSAADLLSASTVASSLAARLGATIFDAGRLRQNVEIQTALQEQAYISYESTVLSALQEAENAMVAFVQEQDRHTSLTKAAQAARQAAELAENQYESGLADFQVVLVAQRAALSLEDQVASSESDITANLIRLYKALGGGWSL